GARVVVGTGLPGTFRLIGLLLAFFVLAIILLILRVAGFRRLARLPVCLGRFVRIVRLATTTGIVGVLVVPRRLSIFVVGAQLLLRIVAIGLRGGFTGRRLLCLLAIFRGVIACLRRFLSLLSLVVSRLTGVFRRGPLRFVSVSFALTGIRLVRLR